jgi:hypothetical protein
MKRWFGISVVGLALVVGGGCASLKFTNPFAAKRPVSGEVLTAADWQALKAENRRRLVGRGIGERAAATQPATGNAFEQFAQFVRQVFYETPRRVLSLYAGKTPGTYARMMEDDTSADARRLGILRLVADYPFAREDPYVTRYWQIAQGDPNVSVRQAAVRALDRSRDARVVPLAIKYLEDPDAQLRLEAAKALANLPDERAVPALTRHMNGTIELRGESGRLEPQQEDRDVRVACADALRNFATKDVARSLVDVLRDKQFEVSYQAKKSLMLLTGHDYRYNAGKWREYLTATARPFE